ncbi:MAG TPA: hypothetical protein VK864_08350 [Longimicrobiales bacterium]|nr:hypothetical protein [Longimicrobiales bacterium]
MKLAIILLVFLPAHVFAQEHADRPYSATWGVQAIGLLTHASPAVRGEPLTEWYLTQPNLFAHATAHGLELRATLNLEGLTLTRGELNAGTWGEGYVDRRHPHTYAHELIGSFRGEAAGLTWSLAAGRGFAPFGTDDPMVRPLLKFPANHHLAQILERLVAVAAIRRGPAIVELAAFNGDEPLDPNSLGTLDRFGDSWSARVTLLPLSGLEVQNSRAFVRSPEQVEDGDIDQAKWSVSARSERAQASDTIYVLAEWMRTAEVHDGDEVLVLHSALAEASAARGPWRAAARVERTLRPESERTTSIFRFPWPHADATIFGLTRWVNLSLNVSRRLSVKRIDLTPVVEVSHQRPRATVEPAFFGPEQLFGSDRLWSWSLGLRAAFGAPHKRMGRYGAALVASGTH